MNKVNIDNICVEGDLPRVVLRHAALKAKLEADSAPPIGDAEPPPPPQPPSLEQARAWALRRIQAEADARLERLFQPAQQLWIPIFEALHWLENPEPQPEMYPALYGAEARARGETAEQAAKRWLAAYQQLCRQHDSVRTLLYAYTQLISQASDIEHILQLLAELDWDMPALDDNMVPK